MVSDGKGFDSFFKCLCNNNDATIKDLAEHCTAEKEMNGKLMKCMKELVFEMGTVWNCEFIKWCIYGECIEWI